MLVTRMVAVKPLFHSLLTMYWHFPPLAKLLDELDLLLAILEDTELLDLTELETELELRIELLEATEEVTELLELVDPTIP